MRSSRVKLLFCAYVLQLSEQEMNYSDFTSTENALTTTVPTAQYCLFLLLRDVLSHSLVLKEP